MTDNVNTTSLDRSDPIDPKEFRRVLGHFPTGVTVLTGTDDRTPLGATVGSFFSISLDPPLVGFCMGHSSSSWQAIRDSGAFAINILADDQAWMSNRFASKDDDRFDGIEWAPSLRTGSPLLRDVVGHIDCVLESEADSGDHVIVVGRVVELRLDRAGDPLIFLRGGYGSFAPSDR